MKRKEDAEKRQKRLLNELDILREENRKLKRNREEFKQWLIDYRYNATGSHTDGRYCVSLSVTDLLSKMDELKNKGE